MKFAKIDLVTSTLLKWSTRHGVKPLGLIHNITGFVKKSSGISTTSLTTSEESSDSLSFFFFSIYPFLNCVNVFEML